MYLAMDDSYGLTEDGKNIDVGSANCFARFLADEGKGVYQVRVDEFSNELYNPYNLEARVNPVFKRVKKECFDFYVRYLETRSLNYLRGAERNR